MAFTVGHSTGISFIYYYRINYWLQLLHQQALSAMDLEGQPSDENIMDYDEEDDSEPSDEEHDDAAIRAPEDAYFASMNERSSLPKSISHLGAILNSKRRAAQQQQTAISGAAWLDVDDSGTYDPNSKRATPSPTLRIRRIRSPDLDEDGNPIQRVTRASIPVGYSFPMTIVLTSDEGLAYLRSITPGPYQSEDSGSDDETSDSRRSSSAHASYRTRRKAKRPRKLQEVSRRYACSFIQFSTRSDYSWV